MVRKSNSIRAIVEPQRLKAKLHKFFVPGIGAVQAFDLADLKKRVRKLNKKPEEVIDGNK